MRVNVLIVDDTIYYSKKLKEIIETKEININGFEYYVIDIMPFTESAAYTNAQEYIQSNQSNIDLALFDQNLKKGKLGVDLFNLFKPKNRVYKILHSETDESLDETQDELGNAYDYFCKSKSATKIEKALLIYEREILRTIRFGNRTFKDFYLKFDGSLTSAAKECFRGFEYINLFTILYITSDGNDSYTLYYYVFEEQKIIPIIVSHKPLIYFTTRELAFVQMGQKLVVNLLWVSKIDTVEHKVHFLVPNKFPEVVSYQPSPSDNIKNILSQIDNGIHPYFKR